MSTVTCPEGHPSTSTDYCDVCGTPIAPGGGASSGGPGTAGGTATGGGPGGPAGGAAAPQACPHCGAEAAAGALFCENCGYDFTTGSAPAAGAPAAPAGVAPEAGATPDRASGSLLTLPPEPVAPAGPSGPGTSAPATPAPGTPDPGAPDAASAGLHAPPVPGPDTWVAEVWVDPDWYAAQAPEDPLPSVGLPGLVTLRERSLLVGRPSRSRGIHPQVDCGADTGVSRRHCQLSTDGQRWWVEDLQSANGTYVAAAGDPLPTTALTPGQRRELADGDRVYLGGWTRLVVRRALPGEV